MTDKEQLRELERALAEDWRSIKNLINDFDSTSEREVEEELGDLQVDMVLSDGDTLADLIQ